MSRPLTVILGGAGMSGRRASNLLEARRLPVRVVSRSTEIRFDWGEPGTWAQALEGASRAYVTYQLSVSGGATEMVAALGRLAREKGLERIVLLSARGDPGARHAEEGLRMSGVSWTILRASWFSQVFSEGYLADSVRGGVVALPAGSEGEPFIDADDVAYAAVSALTNLRHANTTYELTGPRALTFAEATAEIAAAIGRPLKYREVSPEEFLTRMRRAAVPPKMAAILNERLASVRSGRNATVAHGLEAALDRSPCDFASYARRTATAGVWRAVSGTSLLIRRKSTAVRDQDVIQQREPVMSRAALTFAYRKA